jgi:hypothetical protein
MDSSKGGDSSGNSGGNSSNGSSNGSSNNTNTNNYYLIPMITGRNTVKIRGNNDLQQLFYI